MRSKLWLILSDIHFPSHDPAALKAVFHFIRRNRQEIAGVILNGDSLDCQNLSRHTVGKPRLRKQSGYKKDLDGFKRDILDPISKLLKRGTKKIVICGNHEDWIQSDLLDAAPELQGVIGIP